MTDCPYPIKHHVTCTADYPEKIESEAAREITHQNISEIMEVWTCVDCGASITRCQDGYFGDIAQPDIYAQFKDIMDNAPDWSADRPIGKSPVLGMGYRPMETVSMQGRDLSFNQLDPERYNKDYAVYESTPTLRPKIPAYLELEPDQNLIVMTRRVFLNMVRRAMPKRQYRRWRGRLKAAERRMKG